MSPLRLIAHWLLALTLVVNGVAASAMAAQMAAGAMEAAVVATAPAPETHCGSTRAPEVADHAHHDGASADSHCCDDGRCACACVHASQGVVAAVLHLPPRWSAAAPASMPTPSRPDATPHPSLRPPIALIS
jgi:hypothetical protein